MDKNDYTIDPARLTEEQLLYQLVNLDQIMQEAPQEAEVRRRQLNIENRRRTIAGSH